MIAALLPTSQRSRREARLSVACRLALIVWLSCAPALRADGPVGHTHTGLSGVLDLAAPLAPQGTVVASSAGYALTESFGANTGLHHRLLGTLGVAHTPLPWLSVAALLRGRLDFHPRDALGEHRTGTGDPLVALRAGRALDGVSSAGVLLSAWFPGLDAPSFVASATTLELRGLYARALPSPSLRLVANLGFRLDLSAKAAPDLARLRPGDRSALGLSDFHAIPWGAALVRSVRRDLDSFVVLSGSFLLSTRGDVMAASPLRFGLGGRRYFARGLELEGVVVASFAKRPSFAERAPLVPFEPRVQLTVGLRWDGARARAEAAAEARANARANAEAAARARATRPLKVRGVVRDEQGGPLPDAVVTVTTDHQIFDTVTAYDGSFEISAVEGRGPATLDVNARGYAPYSRELVLGDDDLTTGSADLSPMRTESALRLAVRGFDAAPLAAQVLVTGARGRRVARSTTAADGALELALPAGDYRVTVSCAGYRSQTASVHIDADGVAILNVDLHERAP